MPPLTRDQLARELDKFSLASRNERPSLVEAPPLEKPVAPPPGERFTFVEDLGGSLKFSVDARDVPPAAEQSLATLRAAGHRTWAVTDVAWRQFRQAAR